MSSNEAPKPTTPSSKTNSPTQVFASDNTTGTGTGNPTQTEKPSSNTTSPSPFSIVENRFTTTREGSPTRSKQPVWSPGHPTKEVAADMETRMGLEMGKNLGAGVVAVAGRELKIMMPQEARRLQAAEAIKPIRERDIGPGSFVALAQAAAARNVKAGLVESGSKNMGKFMPPVANTEIADTDAKTASAGTQTPTKIENPESANAKRSSLGDGKRAPLGYGEKKRLSRGIDKRVASNASAKSDGVLQEGTGNKTLSGASVN